MSLRLCILPIMEYSSCMGINAAAADFTSFVTAAGFLKMLNTKLFEEKSKP